MKKILAIALALMLTLSMFAVASAEQAGAGLSIGIVYKQSANAYFQAGVTGFEKAKVNVYVAGISFEK